ncbi:conserved domain protein [Paenibacillus sp. JCM 10914]|nr:conserved domain protein [Paenibacillus sp. JCM 10914]
MDPILTSPNLKLFADSNDTLNYKRDAGNYITQVFGAQMPAITTGFFNVHLTKGIIVQPHWHTNANELVFVISGEVVTSVFDPFTQKLITYKLKPGQVSMLPKGWFHWILTLSDKAHLLTIFDQPTPDIVYGSDFLRHIPKEIMHIAYCINEEEYAKAVAPLKESVILGPPPGCGKRDEPESMFDALQHAAFQPQQYNSYPPSYQTYAQAPPSQSQPNYYGFSTPAYAPYYQQSRPPYPAYSPYGAFGPFAQQSLFTSANPYPPTYQPQPYTQSQPYQQFQYLFNNHPDGTEADAEPRNEPESNTDKKKKRP